MGDWANWNDFGGDSAETQNPQGEWGFDAFPTNPGSDPAPKAPPAASPTATPSSLSQPPPIPSLSPSVPSVPSVPLNPPIRQESDHEDQSFGGFDAFVPPTEKIPEGTGTKEKITALESTQSNLEAENQRLITSNQAKEELIKDHVEKIAVLMKQQATLKEENAVLVVSRDNALQSSAEALRAQQQAEEMAMEAQKEKDRFESLLKQNEQRHEELAKELQELKNEHAQALANYTREMQQVKADGAASLSLMARMYVKNQQSHFQAHWTQLQQERERSKTSSLEFQKILIQEVSSERQHALQRTQDEENRMQMVFQEYVEMQKGHFKKHFEHLAEERAISLAKIEEEKVRLNEFSCQIKESIALEMKEGVEQMEEQIEKMVAEQIEKQMRQTSSSLIDRVQAGVSTRVSENLRELNQAKLQHSRAVVALASSLKEQATILEETTSKEFSAMKEVGANTNLGNQKTPSSSASDTPLSFGTSEKMDF